jgi:uncharacterized protein
MPRANYRSVADLIARKLSGMEQELLTDSERTFHRKEFERLRSELENSGKQSSLPNEAGAKADLNDLLLRIRMAGICKGTGRY